MHFKNSKIKIQFEIAEYKKKVKNINRNKNAKSQHKQRILFYILEYWKTYCIDLIEHFKIIKIKSIYATIIISFI